MNRAVIAVLLTTCSVGLIGDCNGNMEMPAEQPFPQEGACCLPDGSCLELKADD